MSSFIVVKFDRYNAFNSTAVEIEAKTAEIALQKFVELDLAEQVEIGEFSKTEVIELFEMLLERAEYNADGTKLGVDNEEMSWFVSPK